MIARDETRNKGRESVDDGGYARVPDSKRTVAKKDGGGCEGTCR